MKPICVKCQRFYRMRKAGFCFIEAMPGPRAVDESRRPLPGIAEPDRWVPYKLWSGDLWECEDCGHQLVSGTGRLPIAEHYEKDFDERAKSSQLQVNDC